MSLKNYSFMMTLFLPLQEVSVVWDRSLKLIQAHSNLLEISEVEDLLGELRESHTKIEAILSTLLAFLEPLRAQFPR